MRQLGIDATLAAGTQFTCFTREGHEMAGVQGDRFTLGQAAYADVC